MTTNSNVHDLTVTNSSRTASGLRKARKLALDEARAQFSRGHYGAQCKVKYDTVVYVVCRDGVHRLTKSPDGRTLSDRIV